MGLGVLWVYGFMRFMGCMGFMGLWVAVLPWPFLVLCLSRTPGVYAFHGLHGFHGFMGCCLAVAFLGFVPEPNMN